MKQDESGDILQLAETFRLLGDPTRLKVVLACLDAPRSVAEIATLVGASPSLVSHHLRLLRAARLLRKARQGKQAFYSPDDTHVSGMLADMLRHVGEAGALDEDNDDGNAVSADPPHHHGPDQHREP